MIGAVAGSYIPGIGGATGADDLAACVCDNALTAL
jgi:hypothetical protein